MPFGTTVAGACNGTASGNQTILSSPAGVLLDYNNTLYTGDSNNRLLVFTLNNLTGQVLRTFGSWPTFFFLDNRTSNIYISVLNLNLVYIWPTNQTIPPNGVNYGNCSMYCLNTPTGITVDSVGNVYIASYSCNWVQKWAPNATSATLVAGLTNGNSGANSQSFTSPYGLALDEANAFLYVVDRFNNRIQRFVVGGSGIGVTVAGGTNGIAANQLSYPTDVHISKIDGSLYIVDSFNNRIQKWEQNATSGITVAGSPNGTSGNTPYLLKQPYSLTIDYEGNYLYVSDSGNNRIQRFPLY
jgi:DNA-binding beta-propeller fold protein YncE